MTGLNFSSWRASMVARCRAATQPYIDRLRVICKPFTDWFMPRWQPMWQDEKRRGNFLQTVGALLLLFLFLYFLRNIVDNFTLLSKQFSFEFLFQPANYDINKHMSFISYEPSDSNLRAAMVGVLGTINIAFWSCLLGLILGVLIALARLSPNFLLNRLAMVYVETMRNIPLLVQIIFWNIILATVLPLPENAISFGNHFHLSNDGLAMPKFIFDGGGGILTLSLLLMAVGGFLLKKWSLHHRFKTGQAMHPVIFYGLMLGLVLMPVASVLFAVKGAWEVPQFGQYTYENGSLITSVFLALWIGLSVFAASYVAETVRGALLAIPKGQTEAGLAIGLKTSHVSRLVLIPQTRRMIIPPISSEMIGVLKNSALGAAIGYVDIGTTLAGSTLNITGHEIECMILAIGFYLILSLSMSAGINYYNHRISLKF